MYTYQKSRYLSLRLLQAHIYALLINPHKLDFYKSEFDKYKCTKKYKVYCKDIYLIQQQRWYFITWTHVSMHWDHHFVVTEMSFSDHSSTMWLLHVTISVWARLPKPFFESGYYSQSIRISQDFASTLVKFSVLVGL